MPQKTNSNSIEDLMFCFGIRKGTRYSKFEKIKIQAENDWYDGKDAKDNPYKHGTIEYDVWNCQWILFNKNC